MRWEIDPSHAHQAGIPEDMSLDQTTHSLFGVSKVAADVMVRNTARMRAALPVEACAFPSGRTARYLWLDP